MATETDSWHIKKNRWSCHLQIGNTRFQIEYKMFEIDKDVVEPVKTSKLLPVVNIKNIIIIIIITIAITLFKLHLSKQPLRSASQKDKSQESKNIKDKRHFEW